MSVCAKQARVERQQSVVGHERRQYTVQLVKHRRVTPEESVIQPSAACQMGRTHRLQFITMLTHTPQLIHADYFQLPTQPFIFSGSIN